MPAPYSITWQTRTRERGHRAPQRPRVGRLPCVDGGHHPGEAQGSRVYGSFEEVCRKQAGVRLVPARAPLDGGVVTINPLGSAGHSLILHITPFAALQPILDSGYLLSKRQVTPVQDISNPEIQEARAILRPPDPPGGTLHDYVPFYFGHHSPMLLQLATGRVKGFSGKQRDIVYCVSSIQNIQAAGLEFTFTDGHGIVAFTSFFTDLADLDKVDWEMVRQDFWADTREDNDRQRRKQAEFLVKDHVPVSSLLGFAVADDAMKSAVEALLAQYPQHNIPTAVRRHWYYPQYLPQRR